MVYRIETTTTQIISHVWNNGSPDKAILAALRDSNNILSRKATTVWPMMLSAMDKRDLSYNGKPTIAEIAIFAALRSFATYQQAQEQLMFASINNNGKNLLSGLAQLRNDERTRKALDRRVQAMLVSTNVESVINSIYRLVAILKAHKLYLKIDFAQLSQDLYFYQLSYENARRTTLKWGQEYYWQALNKNN